MKNLKGSAVNKIIKITKKMWKLSTMFSKKFNFFCPQKVEKSTLKSLPKKLKSTFFSLLPAQPEQPKQKNSCSKMWLIDQLYIELGLRHSKFAVLKNNSMGVWERNFLGELIPSGNSLKIQCDKSYLYLICPTVLHYAALPIGRKVGRKVNVGLERKVFFLKI